jgi:hypothetical protein
MLLLAGIYIDGLDPTKQQLTFDPRFLTHEAAGALAKLPTSLRRTVQYGTFHPNCSSSCALSKGFAEVHHADLKNMSQRRIVALLFDTVVLGRIPGTRCFAIL